MARLPTCRTTSSDAAGSASTLTSVYATPWESMNCLAARQSRHQLAVYRRTFISLNFNRMQLRDTVMDECPRDQSPAPPGPPSPRRGFLSPYLHLAGSRRSAPRRPCPRHRDLLPP